MNHRSVDGQNGFILKNGTFERFEPIGITWNDSYCRKLADAGPSGCFVKRGLSTIPDFNFQENNCTGKDFTNLLGLVVSDCAISENIESTKDPYQCFGYEWKECQDSPLDILDESNCPIIEELVPIESKPVRIELDNSLLDRFNELSEDELEEAFNTFRPVQSLNPYMTKLRICSIEKVGLV